MWLGMGRYTVFAVIGIALNGIYALKGMTFQVCVMIAYVRLVII